jgi:hypothetical protein
VDEKWFFIMKDHWKLYLTQREIDEDLIPTRCVIHKSQILKVMFLAATARPRWDDNGDLVLLTARLESGLLSYMKLRKETW